MDDSILSTVKKLLGIFDDDTSFDTDIITHINTYLYSLVQMGVGSKGFVVTGYNEKWSDFVGDDIDLDAIRTYIYIKVRLVFDPPSNSFTIDSLKEVAKELEWRMYIDRDLARIDSEEGG